MLDNIKAVIFDLDGTLVDSMWIWKDIDIEYLARFGIEFEDELQENIEGFSFTETANYFKEKYNLKDSIDRIKSDWNIMAKDKYENEVFLKDGALDFLKYLKENNIKTGIATSNYRGLVDILINKLDIGRYFDSIRTSCEVGKGKPYPDIYELVARDLQMLPEYCLVFEDVIAGINAGKNANMKVCAVYDDFSLEQQEEKIKLADYYIDSFLDIL